MGKMNEGRINELEAMIKSRSAIIGVETPEEGRACAILERIAKKQNKHLILWDMLQGFHKANDAPLTHTDEDLNRERFVSLQNQTGGVVNDALPTLSQIAGWTDKQGNAIQAIFVLKDYHPYLQEALPVRALRTLSTDLMRSRKTIILLSPTLILPKELETDVELFSFPLPDRDDLREIVRHMAERSVVPVHLNGDTDGLVEALAGLTEVAAHAAIRRAMLLKNEFSAACIPYINEHKKTIIDKSGRLEYTPADPDRGNIAGMDLLMEEIDEIENATGPAAEAFGVEPSRGFMLVGVSGGGKSLVCRNLFRGKKPIIRVNFAAMKSKYVGESNANLRSDLRTLEAVRGVAWLDEFEKDVGGNGNVEDGGTSQEMLGTFLTWAEEHAGSGVFLAATCNSLKGLPVEMRRRFEKIWFIDVPGYQARIDCFAIHLKKRKREPENFDLSALAIATDGYTGAEIERIVQAAIRRAWKLKAEVTTDILLHVVPTVTPISRAQAEQLQALRQEMREIATWAASDDLPPATMTKKVVYADIEL